MKKMLMLSILVVGTVTLALADAKEAGGSGSAREVHQAERNQAAERTRVERADPGIPNSSCRDAAKAAGQMAGSLAGRATGFPGAGFVGGQIGKAVGGAVGKVACPAHTGGKSSI